MGAAIQIQKYHYGVRQEQATLIRLYAFFDLYLLFTILWLCFLQ